MKVIGIAYEGIRWGMGGSREAPYEILGWIRNLERFSLLSERSIEIESLGVMEIEGSGEKAVEEIEEIVSNDVVGYIGGDHTITLGVIRGVKRYWEKFRVVVLDAHLDSRDTFLGEKFNHGTVVRRIYEEIGDVTVMGVRNVSEEEILWAQGKIKVIPYSIQPLYTDTPVYLSIDIDVFDPSAAPGTGTPEPGGITFRTFLKWLRESSFPLIAFDIVEVSPSLDPTRRTVSLAATIIKEVGTRFFG